ncbi:MAG: YlbF family regulator [Clostridiales bacterium]|nr:YlbF family regulator [Clostridiales bacterium]
MRYKTMMTEEMRKAAEALGDLLKDSDEVKAANAAKAVYDNDEAVQQAIFEYNTQNAVLAKEYQKDEKDEVFMETVKKRIGELYNEIVNNPAYTAYVQAEEQIGNLMKEVNDELNFRITGERPQSACTGNCSSCGGCH